MTDVLVQRTREPEGLNRMLVVSLGLHTILIVFLFFMPALGPIEEEPRQVMTISLGGAPGPQSGGMTPMGGRPVQQVQPPVDARRIPVTAPAPKPPEMTLPAERTRPAPPKPVKEAPKEAVGRTPTQGPEPRTGNTVADTGGRGIGFGLTTGGGGGTGGYLDVGNFCCPEYLATMQQVIQRNWNSNQQVAGQVLVKFTIQRDGRLTGIEVERPSGYFALDQAALRALALTRQLPPLPPAFTEPTLGVHLVFTYNR